MHAAYDYDWITYFQRGLSKSTDRKCNIVSHVDGMTYEITLGRLENADI